jgi:hypothetical protein
MEILVVSAAVAGSPGAAGAVQRTILQVCLKAIDSNRR